VECPLTTSWTLIQGAAAGKRGDRDEFVRRYAPVVRAYLTARWRRSPLFAEIEDAIQEVFVESFRQGGVLGKAEQDRPGGFRAFFYGVVRNVALTAEKKGARRPQAPGSVLYRMKDAGEKGESPSAVFDRAWARSLLKEARFVYSTQTRAAGEREARRAKILDLRFQKGMPIREIAALWKADATFLHGEYAQAREEFKKVLMDVIAAEHPGSRAEVDKVLANLLEIMG